MSHFRNLEIRDINTFTHTQAKLAYLIDFGRLAPSSHNTQPWLFKLGENFIEIYENPKRSLPFSDPVRRQYYLSLGAALQNVLIAVEAFGLKTVVSTFPGGKNITARIDFQSLHGKIFNQSLLNAIVNRHNNRELYQDTLLPEKFIDKIRGYHTERISVILITEDSVKRHMQNIVADAIEHAFSDKNFKRELSTWIKPSLKRHYDGMPGYNIGVPWLVSFFMPTVLRRLNVSKSQRKMHETLLEHAPVYIVLASVDDAPADWVETGQVFERIAVRAEMEGVKVGVLAAPIEIGDHFKSIQRLLNINTRPQMFFRMGYAKNRPRPTPRLSRQEVFNFNA